MTGARAAAERLAGTSEPVSCDFLILRPHKTVASFHINRLSKRDDRRQGEFLLSPVVNRLETWQGLRFGGEQRRGYQTTGLPESAVRRRGALGDAADGRGLKYM